MESLIPTLLLLLLLAGCCQLNGVDGLKPNAGGLRVSFPKGFVFGVASSAYQVEGMARRDGRGPCVWDNSFKIPGLIPNNATGDVTVDQYHRYKDDIQLMQKLNFDAYRFSISWSRIFPDGTGKVNLRGVAYYNRLINYLLKKGITPYVTLLHYDPPLTLGKKYKGFLSRRVVDDFVDYADFCFNTFGDRVKHWMTINEPRLIATFGYDNGIFSPTECSKPHGNCTLGNSGIGPYIVAHNVILSHSAAVKRYREKYQEKQKGSIGIPLDFIWYEPLTRGKADNLAAQRARDFHIGWFIHPIVYGEYPRTMEKIVKERLPKFSDKERKMVKGSFDFIGINHYTTYYVNNPALMKKPNPPDYREDWNAEFAYAKNGVPIGPRANSFWLYEVPWGIYKALTYIKERYGNPTMLVLENGMDYAGNVTFKKQLSDTRRIRYYRSYLKQLKKAVDEGSNVEGYFAWSFLDTYEWGLGYNTRFGLVYVDYETLKRYPKKSAYWFKNRLTWRKH